MQLLARYVSRALALFSPPALGGFETRCGALGGPSYPVPGSRKSRRRA
jgi:hypothetical protein